MLNNDKQLTISTGNNRRATNWPASTIWWSELINRLQTPVRGVETLAEYLALPKSKQDELKDVGGFVAGTLHHNRRKANNVISREVVTLDLDHVQPGGSADVLCRLEGLGCGYAVYSTRKHEEARPRLRVLLPLSRPGTADEYEPLARKLAQLIGIDLCDPSTFEASRLMYWPSCCSDSQYVVRYADRPFLDTDGVLATYTDWRNVAEWPEVPGAQTQIKRQGVKQGNPLEKSGPVGAFCKTYNIYQAIDKFLPGIYTPVDNAPDRFTYTGGSTTGGAVIYDDGAFLYSHHATDPVGGRLVNSFDLVRLHLYGDQDDAATPGIPTVQLPSFRAMCHLAVGDQAVAGLLNQEMFAKAAEFAAPVIGDTDWALQLERTEKTGLPLKTANNILIILENDSNLKGKIAFDEFANRGVVLGALPWDDRVIRRDWGDVDDKGLRIYLEHIYKLSCPSKVDDALGACAYRHKFNDVQDYLKSLEWDGAPRVDCLLIYYLGAEDTGYTRAVTRKSLVGAVARAMTPGVKFDYVPILIGPQGVGKSTLIRLLGRNWFSDSLSNFEGKEAAEMLQGVWINELGELSSLNKSETNIAKQFISRTEDIYREPFGKRTARYPRRCVFWGTTNESEFLKDSTGGRRFWPIETRTRQPVKSVFIDLRNEVDQLWAEAVVRWQVGETLFLPSNLEAQARRQQEEHREGNAKEGLIREFLDRPVPFDWDNRSLGERRMYWQAEFGRAQTETRQRDRVCAAEIWCECLGGEMRNMRQANTREINAILSNLPGWKKPSNGIICGAYGLQRGFKKIS